MIIDILIDFFVFRFLVIYREDRHVALTALRGGLLGSPIQSCYYSPNCHSPSYCPNCARLIGVVGAVPAAGGVQVVVVVVVAAGAGAVEQGVAVVVVEQGAFVAYVEQVEPETYLVQVAAALGCPGASLAFTYPVNVLNRTHPAKFLWSYVRLCVPHCKHVCRHRSCVDCSHPVLHLQLQHLCFPLLPGSTGRSLTYRWTKKAAAS